MDFYCIGRFQLSESQKLSRPLTNQGEGSCIGIGPLAAGTWLGTDRDSEWKRHSLIHQLFTEHQVHCPEGTHILIGSGSPFPSTCVVLHLLLFTKQFC